MFCQPILWPTSVDRLNKVNRWFILHYYSPDNFPQPISWEDYDMAILDPDYHPPLEDVPDQVILIAYVSFGVAVDYRSYWPRAKDQPWLVGEKPGESGNYFVDVRSQAWKNILIQEVIPDIVAKGYDGIFIDNIDHGTRLNEVFPGQFGGSEDAMIQLIRDVHEVFPDLMLISNNAYEFLPKIAPVLSALLVEELFSGINSDTDQYEAVSKVSRDRMVRILQDMRRYHHLAVFNIERIPPENRTGTHQTIQSSHQLGFKPYIVGRKFDRIYSGD